MSKLAACFVYTPEQNDKVLEYKNVVFIIQEKIWSNGKFIDYNGFINNRLCISHSSFDACLQCMKETIDRNPYYAIGQGRKKAFDRRLTTGNLSVSEQKVLDYFRSNSNTQLNVITLSLVLGIPKSNIQKIITNFKEKDIVKKSSTRGFYLFVSST